MPYDKRHAVIVDSFAQAEGVTGRRVCFIDLLGVTFLVSLPDNSAIQLDEVSRWVFDAMPDRTLLESGSDLSATLRLSHVSRLSIDHS